MNTEDVWRLVEQARADLGDEAHADEIAKRMAQLLADDGQEPARVPWSRAEIVTPHDSQARFSHKPGRIEWVGYKDHQTETCDDDSPNVIVRVVTTRAPVQDIEVLDRIQDALASHGLTPAEPNVVTVCGGREATSGVSMNVPLSSGGSCEVQQLHVARPYHPVHPVAQPSARGATAVRGRGVRGLVRTVRPCIPASAAAWPTSESGHCSSHRTAK